jgi:hypothetical protein
VSLDRYNKFETQLLALALRALKDEFAKLEAVLDNSMKNGDKSLRQKYIGNDLPYVFYMDLEGETTVLQT